jgi:hopanoid-associated phosphorylase
VSVEAEPRAAVVAVTGLAKEARIAGGPGVRAVAGGGNARRLAQAIERAVRLGAQGVISFGIAGGLTDTIAAGDWLVARAIVTADERFSCDEAWTRALVERLPGAMTVDVAGCDAPVMEAAVKRALHQATGASAVDTESHIAAAVAAAHKLPFAAFRVVCDGVEQSLPSAAVSALSPDGTIRRAAVARALARDPGQIPALARTAIDARTAFRALLRGRRLLGPGLGFPNLREALLDLS